MSAVRVPRGARVRHRRMRWSVAHVQGRVITIDLTRADLLSTLYHELVHLRHPTWTEKRVARKERQRFPTLSDRDLTRLARLLGTVRRGR